MKDIVILGTGGVSIIRLIEEINDVKPKFNIVGFLEKDETLIGSVVKGYPIIGNDDLLLTECKNCGVVNNIIATTKLHRKVSERLRNFYNITDFPNIVHPSVDLKYVKIGEGNIIYNNVLFDSDVTLGDFNIVYPGTGIGHETVIGNYNLAALNTTIGARCVIGNENVFANASVLSLGLKVGNNNILSVGAVAIEDIIDNQYLLGNPARNSVKVIVEYKKNK